MIDSLRENADARRPIQARAHPFSQRTAAWLARTPLTPNAISILGIVFAAAGAAALAWLPPWGAWLCIAGIVLRLLCNMFDGMVAVEGGKGTPAGALYNEVPDRVADSVLLVALGYAAGLPWVGWLAALLAACTAYVRVLGGTLGQPQDFRGPFAKQHRMWWMVLACAIAPLELRFNGTVHALRAAVVLIAAGSLLTCVLRLRAIGARLDGTAQ